MSLLHDIQTSLLDENAKIGPILLKLRFLADRLGSNVLEDWVRFEAEGYPDKNLVPIYRKTSISYEGTFSNGHQVLNNISIPPYLVEKYSNTDWIGYEISDPLPMIESMIARSNNSDRFGIDASNLKLLLEGKIYPGYAILELNARLDIGAFVRIVSVVRAKLLDFVLELERNVPVSSAIMVGAQTPVSATDSAKVTHLTQNIFNAPVQNITTSGDASPVRANVIQGDTATLEAALADLGLSQRDANELAAIASHEAPTDKSSFGAKAAAWIGRRLSAGADGIMKIGGKVLEDDIAKLFRDFYNTF